MVMKLTVTCLVSSVNSSQLSEAEAVTKEVVVANPRATVQNLRATVAIQFRLNVVAFDFRFDHHRRPSPPPTDTTASVTAPADGALASSSSSSPAHAGEAPATTATVDLSDEKKLLAECGLEDGDHLTVLPKHYQPTAPGAAVTAEASNDADSRAAKKPRTEALLAGGGGGDDEEESELVEEDEDEENSDDGDDEEDDAEASAQNDLFEALHDVVPDLNVLRQEFLANPQAVMERIERNHPSLFQVITQNQETFIRLMNSEQLTKAAQSLLHGGPALGGDAGDDEENSVEWSMGEEDEEEMDEETEAQMHALFQNYIAGAGGPGGDFDAADLAALEASGMEVGDVDEDEDDSGEAKKKKKQPQSEKDFHLSRVPTEEDEKKIQSLTELGFSYDQCKLAFYLCHRSIDRASNMLFEAPPEL